MRLQNKRPVQRLFQGQAGSPLAKINIIAVAPKPADKTAEIALEIIKDHHDRKKAKVGRPAKNKAPMTGAERSFLSRMKKKREETIEKLVGEQQKDKANDSQSIFMPGAPHAKGKVILGGNATDMEQLDIEARRISCPYDPENSLPAKCTAIPIADEQKETEEAENEFINRQNFTKDRKWTKQEKEQMVLDELTKTGIVQGRTVGDDTFRSDTLVFSCSVCHLIIGEFRRDGVKHLKLAHQALIDARIKEMFSKKKGLPDEKLISLQGKTSKSTGN